jgi:hypothetical protein
MWYSIHVYNFKNQLRVISISITSIVYHFFVLGNLKFLFWNIPGY